MSTSNRGIDYGLGQSNVDKANGIRYGVISQHSVMPESLDSIEYDYGKPGCPHCGRELPAAIDDDDCPHCQAHIDDSSLCYADEPVGWSYTEDGYKLCDCLDSDIFVIKSNYYTHAQFCSPCVPGACNLDSPCQDGAKCYCLGHDWFDGGKAPYPVFSVETGRQIVPHDATEVCPNCTGTGRDTLARIADVRQCTVTNLLCQIDLGKEAGLTDVDRNPDSKNFLTFECFRCHGKGSLPVINYVEEETAKA